MYLCRDKEEIAMTSMGFFTWFNDVTMADLLLVGGKNASLGEMLRNLDKASVKIPHGFAITTNAFVHFLESNNIKLPIHDLLKKLDPTNLSALNKTSAKIKEMITAANFDEEFVVALSSYYDNLKK